MNEDVDRSALVVATLGALESKAPQPDRPDELSALLSRAGGVSIEGGDLDEQTTTMAATSPPTPCASIRLRDATRHHIHQVVPLGAGLDTRADRPQSSSAPIYFEVDRPEVVQFKARVLGAHDVEAPARHVEVDLRLDWPAVLSAAGHDPQRLTLWIAEGLLPQRPADAERALFECVHHVSPVGSVLCAEHVGEDPSALRDDSATRARMDSF